MKLTKQLELLRNKTETQLNLINRVFREEGYLIVHYYEFKPWTNSLFIQISNELDCLEVRYCYDEEYHSCLSMDLLDMNEKALRSFVRKHNEKQKLSELEEEQRKNKAQEEIDRKVLAALQAKYGIINES